MALPSIATPEFITKIPSTGQEIKYRPFLVKEEKILLMALEGGDQTEITNAIVNILSSCILDDVDVSSLAMFDFEYLFMKLRGKSVGEVIELKVGHTSGDCQAKTDVQVNIDSLELSEPVQDKKIMLTDDIGVMLKYPSLKESLSAEDESTAGVFKVISRCIDYIFDANEVYNEFSEKEIEDWLNTLNQSQFKKIIDFFEGMPKLRHEVKWKCQKCGENDTVVLEGMQSFFM